MAEMRSNGTPDAGVECYAILRDGSEWGWQSKYFDTLGDAQWPQLDKSAKTAIEKHPRLTRYFICVPLDRANARIPGQRSARERWDDHVQKWQVWASDRGMSVEFVYKGSSELLELLQRPEHVGRVRFWFDIRHFDVSWFTARLDEAIQAAGPRYTPEIHVDLPVATEFEAFGRTSAFFDQLKTFARRIREKLGVLSEGREGAPDPTIGPASTTVLPGVQSVLSRIGGLHTQPIGALPFSAIAALLSKAEASISVIEQGLFEREREYDATPVGPEADADRPSRPGNPFRNHRARLAELSDRLREAHEGFTHAEATAGRALMIIRGQAGTGKTHLLCDAARLRVAAGLPTVLLLGQRFLTSEDPWTQALQQLDLTGVSAEEFVGALESAAQAANCRALLMIDAVNEGSGRTIWPSHAAAFLARLERSPWIGVVFSVRSSYERRVLPEQVLTRAVRLTHEGFADHEYDATQTFFTHYGLELPSTPLLAPEFRNPLFLKTVCAGLHAKGERRFPRGFQGISAVFDMYLDGVNSRLALALDFDPRTPLVRRALEAVSGALLDSGQRWLTMTMTTEVVNALLPHRTFDNSLYRGLVVEAVLVEEGNWNQEANRDEIVVIAYERLADHLVARTLIDRHLDTANPALAFSAGHPLAFLCDEDSVEPGLLEAFCIQIPEHTGCELIALAPGIAKQWGIRDAFRQSVVWRTITAFSEDTHKTLKAFVRTEPDLDDTLDVLLTVATLPGHPMNALYLDKRLRHQTMPKRDEWWSVYLHRAWRGRGAVDRLVDWASSVATNDRLDDETLDLCAASLSWMLTTSNRFLRDRATKALVNLLTGRLTAVVRLIERFADIDDPYVVERLYAVAYGTAMRSHDAVDVGRLGTCVYTHVFASGHPPVHILLRDYARGVIERAIDLGSALDIAVERIRPPYSSSWPTIPSEAAIKDLTSSSIGFSVMHWDFARYVIGTNSSSMSTHWLSLTLDGTEWEPPAGTEDLRQSLTADLSDSELRSWKSFDAIDQDFDRRSRLVPFAWFLEPDQAGTLGEGDTPGSNEMGESNEEAHPIRLEVLERKRKEALATLKLALAPEHGRRLDAYLQSATADRTGREPPRFDLSQIQRYVLWRAFDLGWTADRFNQFDRYTLHNDGGTGHKAERIGKKYQWIAYHEILALVADNFQYREQFRTKDGDRSYEGPWQNHLRDIDPSCTLRAVRGGTSWEGHSSAWWGSAPYDNWGNPANLPEWIRSCDDIPGLSDLLIPSSPNDASRWVNVDGYFNWRQPVPADQDSSDVEQRDLWCTCSGYLIRTVDAEGFMNWAEGVDFWGRWMPDGPEFCEVFLGEHGWAPASRSFQRQYVRDGAWSRPDHGCPVEICPAALGYVSSGQGVDCSVDEGFTLHLPCIELVSGMGLRWNGSRADYVDGDGRLAGLDPTVDAKGPTALLLREDLLRNFLVREGLTICWAVLGEKRVLRPDALRGGYREPTLRMSGAYVLSGDGPVGFLKCVFDDPNQDGEASLLTTIRTSNRRG